MKTVRQLQADAEKLKVQTKDIAFKNDINLIECEIEKCMAKDENSYVFYKYDEDGDIKRIISTLDEAGFTCSLNSVPKNRKIRSIAPEAVDGYITRPTVFHTVVVTWNQYN